MKILPEMARNGCIGSGMSNVIVLDSHMIQQLDWGEVDANRNLARYAKFSTLP